MADDATDAILFGSIGARSVASPPTRLTSNNLYTQAESLTHSVDHAVSYAKVQPEYRELRTDLGVKSSS